MRIDSALLDEYRAAFFDNVPDYMNPHGLWDIVTYYLLTGCEDGWDEGERCGMLALATAIGSEIEELFDMPLRLVDVLLEE